VSFTIATTLDQALAAISAGATPIAGGTDLVVGARQGKAPLPTDLVAIDRIESLRAITADDGQLVIGALVSHAMLMEHPLVVAGATALADAAALVGSPATRNVGTLGGNVMNGSPAMDTGAPLMVLGAVAVLESSEGRRTLPLDELWTGPGSTSAEPNELCVALRLPPQPAHSGSAYVRLEYRRAMEIAVVGAAARVALDPDGGIDTVDIALSAVAPTIVAVTGLESLRGGSVESALDRVAALVSDQAQPISDLRASDRYRRHTVGVMARRAVEAAARRAGGETIGVPVNRTLGIGAAS
jgi:CO/xanthine dehydrogenase FAD-binding subunit